MKKIGADTNPGRDAEVGLAWVESLGAGLRAGHRRGTEWLARRLTERRDATYRAVAREVVADFGELAERLRERLGRYTVEVRLDRTDAPGALGFRAALAAELDRHAAELDRALGAIASVADEELGHQARIEAKRLRYLLEPVAARLPGARKAVGHLKSLQDRLGELHDLQVLAAEVAQAVAEVAGEGARRAADAALAGADADGHLARAASRRSERPGLLALARRIGSRRDEIFAAFEARWLGERAGAANALAGEIRGLIDELTPDASSPADSPAP